MGHVFKSLQKIEKIQIIFNSKIPKITQNNEIQAQEKSKEENVINISQLIISRFYEISQMIFDRKI